MEYSIAQVAKKKHLSAYTLRYYDKEGLLPFVARDGSGNRIFTEDNLEIIDTICCLKDTGMPIRQIKSFIDFEMTGNTTLHERDEMLKEHREYVIKQIEALKENLNLIDSKLNYYKDACEAYDNGKPIPCCRDYHISK